MGKPTGTPRPATCSISAPRSSAASPASARALPAPPKGAGPARASRVAHVCIDDHSRLVFAEVLPDERKETTTAFLSRALDQFQTVGISVERIMTDNGCAYHGGI